MELQYVPLGKTLVNQPLRVEFGIEGAHVHHSASLNILPDWFNVAKDAKDGAMTAYLEDNMQSHTNQREYVPCDSRSVCLSLSSSRSLVSFNVSPLFLYSLITPSL